VELLVEITLRLRDRRRPGRPEKQVYAVIGGKTGESITNPRLTVKAGLHRARYLFVRWCDLRAIGCLFSDLPQPCTIIVPGRTEFGVGRNEALRYTRRRICENDYIQTFCV